MMPKISRSWKASSRSASGPACTSAPPARAASTTSSTRSSTTPSTKPSPATAPASSSPSTPTTRSPWSTTAAASPSGSWRSTTSRPPTIVLTMLHAGGKFGGAGYKVSGGLHGVGVSVVNALIEWLELEITRRLRLVPALRARATRSASSIKKRSSARTHRPAPRSPSWPTRTSSRSRLQLPRARPAPARDRVPHQGPAHQLNDERAEGESVVFQYEGGIVDFVAYLNREKDAIHRSIIFLENETEDGAVEIAMQWNSAYNETIFTFANNINTTEGGTHLSGFRAALTRTINGYARQKNSSRRKRRPQRRGRARGPHGGHLGQAQDPQFEGQTKTKLGNSEVETLVKQTRQREAGRVPRGEPRRRQADRGKAVDAARARRPPARPATSRGARACSRAARCRASWPTAPSRTRPQRDLPRRGRLGRRLRQAGARPHVPGDPAAARQDHQRREGAPRQDARQPGDPDDDQRPGRRHRRRVRPRASALPQDHHHDRRRRGRLAHPHAAAHVLLPPHEAAGRGRLRLHRPAAAVPAEAGQPGDVHPQGGAARGDPAARPPRADPRR